MGRVIIVGSINVDLVVTADRFPRPGETILGQSFGRHPGGKGANQAIAAARFGAPTLMAGAVGDDAFGAFMRATLEANGVDVALVGAVPHGSTGMALITVAGGENCIVVIPGANGCLSLADTPLSVAADDVVVAQLETPIAATRTAFEAARSTGAATILNPAPASRMARDLLALATMVVVNETELEMLTGTPVGPEAGGSKIAASLRSLRTHSGQIVIATLGARGLMALAESDRLVDLPGHAVEPVDTTGAGDCFVGALAASLVQGTGLEDALARANAAAALAVQRPGAGSAMPTAGEVDAFLAAQTTG